MPSKLSPENVFVLNSARFTMAEDPLAEAESALCLYNENNLFASIGRDGRPLLEQMRMRQKFTGTDLLEAQTVFDWSEISELIEALLSEGLVVVEQGELGEEHSRAVE